MAGTAQPPQGIGEVFQVGTETTYGSAGTIQQSWRPVSNTLRRKDPWRPLSGPTGYAFDMAIETTSPTFTDRGFRGTPDVSGTVVVEADYNSIGWLVLYANDFSSETVADVTDFTHTSNITATIPTNTPVSFTAERITELEQFRYTGCVINALEISGAGDRIVTVSADIIGQDGGAADVSPAAASYEDTAPWVEFHDSEFQADFTTPGSGSPTAQDSGNEAIEWTYRLENNFQAIPAAGSGVRGIRQPRWMGYRSVTMTVTRDYFDNNFFNAYHQSTLADAAGSYWIHCVSDTQIASNAYYTLSMRINSGVPIDGLNEYTGGPDILGENVVIKAISDADNAPPAVITMTNSHGTEYSAAEDAIT